MISIRLTFLGLLAGCSTSVDTADLPPIDGFEDWPAIITTETVPGHGDTYRILYANEVAMSWPGVGRYPVGSVFVKDVRAEDGEGPGDRRYLAIMRKLSDPASDPDAEHTQSGWLFTQASEAGGTESTKDSCYDTCHAQAPVDGVWLGVQESGYWDRPTGNVFF